MLQNPAFKPHLQVTVVEDTGVFVLAESRQLLLRGRLYELVAPLLDGRAVEEVCRELKDIVPPAQVFYTVRALEKRGFISERNCVGLPPEAALWTAQNIEHATALTRLSETAVAVTGFGVDVAPLCLLLEESGVRIDSQGSLGLVVTDNYLNTGLRSYNEQAISSGRTWMLAKPVGGIVWVGPVFIPSETACWECLALKMRSNFPILGYLESLLNRQGAPPTDRIRTPATLSTAWGLIATTVANWVVQEGRMPGLESQIQSINLLNLGSQTHTLLKQPACAACGQATAAGEASIKPLVLESRKKVYTDDGGHRSMTPLETIAKYQHHVSPICGAVTMLEDSVHTGGDAEVMHVFASGNNVARGPESLFNLTIDLRNQSAGKGITAEQARASALCEGLERYCGNFRGDEPRRTARFTELGDAAIDPNDCMRISERQYQQREETNARSASHCYIPLPFDPRAEIEWSPLWSLSWQCVRYLPTQFCYFSAPHSPEHSFCLDCSNGNSAGNTLEEAIVQGFLELVERDAIGLWWYNRYRVPGVDLDSFDEPYLSRLRAFLESRNRDLWVLDVTSDLGIPVFAALSRRLDGGQEQIMFGFGAHFESRIALLRAVTEMNQMLIPVLDDPADGPPRLINETDTVSWLQTATCENQPYLVPHDGPARVKTDYSMKWSDDIRDDVLFCQSLVEQRGMEMLVLDQTRPEISMPVVKVVVPGLRHFWPRYASGRLFDVPVQQGHIDKPRSEEELNPIAVFL